MGGRLAFAFSALLLAKITVVMEVPSNYFPVIGRLRCLAC